MNNVRIWALLTLNYLVFTTAAFWVGLSVLGYLWAVGTGWCAMRTARAIREAFFMPKTPEVSHAS